MEEILVMRSKEARRLYIIEQVIERQLTQKQAAEHLGLTDLSSQDSSPPQVHQKAEDPLP